MPFSKKLDCNTKSEPPYLVITLKFEPTSPRGEGEELTTKLTLIQMFWCDLHLLCWFNQFWFLCFKYCFQSINQGFWSQFFSLSRVDTWVKFYTQMLTTLPTLSKTPIVCKQKFNTIYKQYKHYEKSCPQRLD